MPLVTVDVGVAMTAMQYVLTSAKSKFVSYADLGGRYLVATTTVWSGASYLYSKDAVRILNQHDKKQTPPGEKK